jgi:hypothetical protein
MTERKSARFSLFSTKFSIKIYKQKTCIVSRHIIVMFIALENIAEQKSGTRVKALTV